MRFARVHGRVFGSSSCDDGLVLMVTVEEGHQFRTVRHECISPLPLNAQDHPLRWWADQLTQETIGTVLALDGWEAIAESTGDTARASVDTATVTYVIRRL
ncbi:MAG: hypothetical protein AB7V46_12890 [Thermomicrobiales bacterium]